ITFIIFIIIGFNYETNGSVDDVKAISQVIQENFNINGWLFIVPLVVLVLIVKKVPAIPALLVGALLGGVFAIIFQPEIIALIADEGGSYAYLRFKAVMMSLYGEISVVTSNDVVNELLVTRGMGGMLNTIWLIICA
ncbi:MAG TPA: sodium:proton antiporter, partial [Algoriphagus sp.]|nr:sodium:proton antiporter [Algoriphagus sp.]